jgi:hypothetical protein
MQSFELPEAEVRLQLLSLADTFSEDGEGNMAASFCTGPSKVTLHRNSYDGDTSISLTVNGQEQPLIVIDLKGCKAFRIEQNDDSVLLEAIAVSELDYRTRGTYQADSGFRIIVRPIISIQPFFRAAPAPSPKQSS